MTAPVTNVAILFTGTALLFNSLRGTHRQSQILCTGTVFSCTTLHDAQNCRFSAQGQRFRLRHTRKFQVLCTGIEFVFNYSARRTELQIICTEIAFSFTSLRDCIRLECACAVCFLLIIRETHRKVQILFTGTADCARESA